MSTISEHLKTGITSPESAKAKPLSFAQAQNKLSANPTNAEETLAGKDGFSFGDLVDVINPLQHIPGVSTVYRAITGDEMGAAAKVAGAALFGGPIGAGLALADTAVELATGEDTAGNITDALAGDGPAQTSVVPTATVLSADATVSTAPTLEEQIAQAVADASDGAVLLPKEDEEKKEELAAQAALNASGPFRLGIDTVADPAAGKSEKAAVALAEAVKPEVNRVGIALNPDISDVTMKALGGTSLPHQIYRQVQTVDPLYTRALDMSS